MSTKKQLERIKRISIPILKKNGVVKAGIFGSYARGEAKKNSDIDLLIKFKGRKSLLDLSGLKIELESKLTKKVRSHWRSYQKYFCNFKKSTPRNRME